MKYGKFEEWMVGKHVTYGTYSGKVVKGCEEGDYLVYVLWEVDDKPAMEFVKGLEFVEESENTQVEIDWQVGQVVWDVRNGRGVITRVNVGDEYPVHVVFDLKDVYGGIITDTYTIDGRYVKTQKARSLFFSEPVVTAELYPPKKPFTPTLKKGDTVVAKRKDGRNTVVFYVVDEYKDVVKSSGAAYSKSDWVFYKLGEEVKFQ